jgi:L-amino acid ligase
MSLPRPNRKPKIGEYDLSQYFVIVDGFSSGRYIAPKLLGNGYNGIIHVLSKAAKEVGYQLTPDQEKNYSVRFEETDDINELINHLSTYRIKAIIPGAHAGVDLADKLNHLLHLPMSNDFNKSAIRLDKYLMQEEIRKQGLRAPKQCLVSDMETLQSWINQNKLPIVLKPLSSSGTDGVYFCKTQEEVETAFNHLMENKTVYGQKNTQIVAQEMLMGKEYMVNTVSCRDAFTGEYTYVTDILIVEKKIVNGVPLYDYAMNLDRSDPIFLKIKDYVSKVLSALGLYYGAAHTEVIINEEDHQPTLVEVNPRLMGTYDMSALTEATGTNQVEQLVQIYNRDGCLYLHQLHYQVRIDMRYTLASFMMTGQSGNIEQTPNVDLFRNIPNFHSIKLLCEKGKDLKPTSKSPVVNLPGVVNFVAESHEELLISHQKLRDVEKQFYDRMLTKKQKSNLLVNSLYGEPSTSSLPKPTPINQQPQITYKQKKM